LSANRLEERLERMRSRGERGLAPYVTAGDGGLATTLEVLRALDGAGAACVELGVPFSDPIADGPVLQAAAERGLAAGTGLDGILEMVREFRSGSGGSAGSDLPVALFCYANPLVRRGWEEACRQAARAGVDALLVPDLPVEEGGPMRAAALSAGLCPVFFVAPTTSQARLEAAAGASRGFLYAIGRFGVTGAPTELDASTLSFLRRVKEHCALPLAVGFGIGTPEQVATVLGEADLAVVGSALVQHVHEAASKGADFVAAAAHAACAFLRSLQEGCPTP